MAILKCTCKSTFQDKTYGQGMRVCNPMKSKVANKRLFRCTVCGAEKET